jgi:hypothetical protein
MNSVMICVPRIIKMVKSMTVRWPGQVEGLDEESNEKLFLGKPEGRKPLERTRHKVKAIPVTGLRGL